MTDTADRDVRCVLEGVPRVGFYHHMQQHPDSRCRCPEDICLTGCLRASLEHMRDSVGCHRIGIIDPTRGVACGNAWLLGVTGIAWKMSWKDGWEHDNVATWLIGRDAGEVFRRAFDALGYERQILCGQSLPDAPDERREALRQAIVTSIRDRGRPVIAHGVVGPPEECLIAGYDDGGRTLIGWSYFQDDPEFAAGISLEAGGMFRKPDALDDVASVLIFGDRRERPKMKEVLREALRWAIETIRTPRRFDRHNGLAGFDAWIDHLGRDGEFAGADEAALRRRFEVHDMLVGQIAETRWYASIFLSEATRHLPMVASHLLKAAACGAAQHELMWKAWEAVGGHGRSEAHVARFAQPEARRRIADLLRQARALDDDAARHMEAAIGRPAA